MNMTTYTPFEEQFSHFLLSVNETENNEQFRETILALLRDMRLGHTCSFIEKFNINFLLEQKIVSFYDGKVIPNTPLVLTQDRLYLQRYFCYEKQIAYSIIERLKKPIDLGISSMIIPNTRLDMYQKLAIFTAASRQFSIITGGPGTGKTTSILYVIMAALRQNPDLKIVLCAPTGKAQTRMKQSILKSLSKESHCDELLSKKITSIPSSTIHRLLGVRFNSTQFKHNASNPIGAQMVIVDECSMISLSLMAKLLDAIPMNSKVVLLGDKNQLPSVEAGSLFADICALGTPNCVTTDEQKMLKEAWNIDIKSSDSNLPLSYHFVELQRNYRFKSDEHIGLIAEQIKMIKTKEDSQKCHQNIISIINDSQFAYYSERHFFSELKALMHRPICTINSQPTAFIELKKWCKNGDYSLLPKAFALTESFKILCSIRDGIYGFGHINLHIKEEIGLREETACGLPIMIIENRPDLDLYNGDTGILWYDEQGRLKAFFKLEGESDLFRPFAIAQLPKYEVNFAMTIHKSQGSGFENVLALLSKSEILCRELLYTAITRAEKHFYLFSEKATIESALMRKTERYSGFDAHF